MAEVAVDLSTARGLPGAPPGDPTGMNALARLRGAGTLAAGPDDLGAWQLFVDEDDVIEWKRLDLARRLFVLRMLGRREGDHVFGLVWLTGPVGQVPEGPLSELIDALLRHVDPQDGPLVSPFVALHDGLPRHALAFAHGPGGTRVLPTPGLHDAEDAGPDALVLRDADGLHALDDRAWCDAIRALLNGSPARLGPAIAVPEGALTVLAPGRVGVVRSHGWLFPLDLPRPGRPEARRLGRVFLAPSTYARALPGRSDVALAITSLDGVLHRQRLRVTEAVAPLLSAEST